MPSVIVDCFPACVEEYRDTHAIVAVDVIRATTTALTALEQGRRCFPVPSLEVAVPLAARLDNPLLVGELGGNVPYGFDLNNSPAAIAARRADVERPMILLSTTGTPLLWEARGATRVYAAALRNWSRQVEQLVDDDNSVAVIGAGARGEFREEDQLCCAWIAQALVERGFESGSRETEDLIDRWRGARADEFLGSKSVEYLRQTGQLDDLEFILTHIDDLDSTFELDGSELVKRT